MKNKVSKICGMVKLISTFYSNKSERGSSKGSKLRKTVFIQKQNKMLQKMSKEKDKSKINLQKVIKELFRLAW